MMQASGEKAVRDEFPTATIVRPAQVFSPEDKLLNLIGSMCRYIPRPCVAASCLMLRARPYQTT
jgi:hypothetical protein